MSLQPAEMKPRDYLARLIADRYEVYRQARRKGGAARTRAAARDVGALVDIWALVQGG